MPLATQKKKMIGGLFYTDELIAISQENERRYTREEINQRCVHLETWLRSSGWIYLNLALCRRRKKGLFLQLPASCIKDITNMKIDEPITPTLVKQRLEPHLMRGSRLFDPTDYQQGKEWAGGALLVRCAFILNRMQTEQDLAEMGEMQIRIFPTCAACSKELERRLTCSKCGVVCYCNAECQRRHWKTHKTDCTLMGEALDELELYYHQVTPPDGQHKVLRSGK
jgi:hypothetical protein